MLIGVPKEIKADEYRVALTPAGAEMLSEAVSYTHLTLPTTPYV